MTMQNMETPLSVVAHCLSSPLQNDGIYILPLWHSLCNRNCHGKANEEFKKPILKDKQ